MSRQSEAWDSRGALPSPDDRRARNLILLIAGPTLRSPRGSVARSYVGLAGDDHSQLVAYLYMHREGASSRPRSSIRYLGADLDDAIGAAKAAEDQMRSLGFKPNGSSETSLSREAFERTASGLHPQVP